MADSKLPLAGAVLCCTSIPPETRSIIAAVASELGAEHKLDLTSDVTHLLVGEVNTPKYRYVAKERPDVKVLLPDFVEAVRQSWMEGGEVEVKELEARFRAPTLYGLRICITGFEDIQVRDGLREYATSHGAEYRPDLTKECTHLIACHPKGAKYEYAKIWNVKIVALEWLGHSLEREMVLEESLYDPLMPVEERGKQAWIREPSTLMPRKRKSEDGVVQPARKLRRSASSKLANHREDIWGEIVGVDSGRNTPTLDFKEIEFPDPFAPAELNQEQATHSTTEPEVKEVTAASTVQAESRSLFGDVHFFLHGFNETKTEVLKNHLESNGGQILSSLGEASADGQSTLIIAPYTCSRDDLPRTPGNIDQPAIVTELWVEKCLYKKSFQEPRESVAHRLFQHPISGFENLSISSTAFEGIELKHLYQIVSLLGAKYEEVFSASVSVLISNDLTTVREKMAHAHVWGIPVVKPDWLWKSIEKGQKESFSEYLIPTPLRKKPKSEGEGSAKTTKSSAVVVRERSEPKDEDPAVVNKPTELLPERTKKKDLGDMGRKKPVAVSFAERKIEDSFATKLPEVKPSRHEYIPPEGALEDDSWVMVREDSELIPERQPTPSLEKVSGPLSERSPNSPSRKPPSPSKTDYSPSAERFRHKSQARKERESLSREVSSLLARRHERRRTLSRTLSGGSAISLADSSKPLESRRGPRLLSRVNSNASIRSNGSARPPSRADSLDTMNTDGVGTPIETSNPFSRPPEASTSSIDKSNAGKPSPLDDLTAALLEPEQEEHGEEEPQMTQLGYEDPDGEMWHEQLVQKMYGKSRNRGIEAVANQVAVAASLNDESEGIARRTRAAGTR